MDKVEQNLKKFTKVGKSQESVGKSCKKLQKLAKEKSAKFMESEGGEGEEGEGEEVRQVN